MFKPILSIQELKLGNDELTITVKITSDSDVRVRSPKVRVIFRNGREERRLPMLIEADYITTDMKSNVVYAKYKYFLKELFIPYNEKDKIDISFAYAYGEDYVEEIPFSLSRDISLENEEYAVNTQEELGMISIQRVLLKEKDSRLVRLAKLVKQCFRALYSLILYVIGLLLFPLFLVDAIVSRCGLSPKSRMNHSRGLMWYASHVRWRYSSFCKKKMSFVELKLWFLLRVYQYYCHKPVVQNRVAFLSSRRADMTGNLGFVYDMMKEDKSYDIQILLDPDPLKVMKLKNVVKLAYLAATSKVLLVDDFFPALNRFELRKETKLIQLWHACGAFKTFGFSRLGKKGGPTQTSKNHRNYNYAIVSSKEIAKYYAEGFGITSSHVVATGVPRTDIFFNETYKEKVVSEFYEKYPHLRDKKIILFAPTFRGNGKGSAYYTSSRFDAVQVYENTNHEYAIIIKHHPFVKDHIDIPKEYEHDIIDMSNESELNDLLFVTDLVITDYSSLIFEASLLNIPMLFYAYDLRRYIATRDFYYEYELFVPGKIVSSQSKLIKAINKKDFESEKIEGFKKQFFDHLDGRSTERLIQLIQDIMVTT